MNEFNKNYLLDLINILSFLIGIQNLELNDKQIQDLQVHLNKQDKQYEEIIELLKNLKGEKWWKKKTKKKCLTL